MVLLSNDLAEGLAELLELAQLVVGEVVGQLARADVLKQHFAASNAVVQNVLDGQNRVLVFLRAIDEQQLVSGHVEELIPSQTHVVQLAIVLQHREFSRVVYDL